MSENSVIGLGSNFNTDDKYGHQSEWYKKQIKEEAKFAFEHNSVSLEETGYDGRPIVNEARAIANGAICVLRDRGYRNMFDNFEAESQEEIVDALTELAQMHIDSVLAKNNIYEQPAIDNPNALPKMSPFEQNYVLAKEAHIIANHWDMTPETLGQRERIMGAVHGVLDMLQNGNPSVPAMQLIPIDPETDEGCVAQLVRRDEGLMAADWNYNTPMGLKWTDPNYGHLSPENPPTSLTAQFQHIYETTRERYRTSARDLFGDPSDD